MIKVLPTKWRFHLALYAAFLGLRKGRFAEISGTTPAAGRLAKTCRIYFWTPSNTPGANFIVHDLMPDLTRLAGETAPGWKINFGPALPENPVDWLVCFKAVPDKSKIKGRPRLVLLICDQAEVFWDSIGRFDAVVATSSRPFAGLVATQHPHTTFIGETETVNYTEFGGENLAVKPAARSKVLLWHGGPYSQDALNDLRPALADWAATTDVQLHVVSGKAAPRVEKWGALTVNYFPWSKEQMFRSAAQARLGFVPARFSLKQSWLKPAARQRVLHALGVPAIGDDRVPDVVDFTALFNGATAGRGKKWINALAELWNDPAELERLAKDGQAVVAKKFSTPQTARQWMQYFSQT